jgi:hypothetical protein
LYKPGRWFISEEVLYCSRAIHLSFRVSSTTQLLSSLAIIF